MYVHVCIVNSNTCRNTNAVHFVDELSPQDLGVFGLHWASLTNPPPPHPSPLQEAGFE